MAKWTGEIKRVKRWFRSDKLLVQFRKEPGDHNSENDPELYWCEVDPLRLDIIAFDLQCRRNEVDILTAENKRLREKLVLAGSDTKIEVNVSSTVAADELSRRINRSVQETMDKVLKDHVLWIRKPDDVDLRTSADIARKFAGGMVEMPVGAPTREMPGDSV